MAEFETIIGLEVHVQVGTRSKAFCADSTTFGQPPNTQVSAVSLAHPGTLPRSNRRQVELAARLGLALGSQINLRSTFDRKNYFYADLPKGYQITQDQTPICVGGELDVYLDGNWRSFRIHHIHMEEDAGKSQHAENAAYSQIDLNRAGVPLLEIVTEPDLRSAAEVDAFMTAMRQLVRYLGVSDGNMEQGSMRCDINVSIRPRGAQELRARCEIKNINSMRYARQAIAYEVARQQKIVAGGGTVQQQTRNFDPDTGRTYALRDKENAHDYRYFPEPDLPPVLLTPAELATMQKQLPALPRARYEQFRQEYQLSDYDARLLVEERETADLFSAMLGSYHNPKGLANLIINRLFSWCQEHQVSLADLPANAAQLAAFQRIIDEGLVSHSTAYQRLFPQWIRQAEEDPRALAQALNLVQNSNTNYLEELALQVISANPDKVKVYRKGKKGLLGFFMGQLMRASKGKADPQLSKQLLQRLLDTSEDESPRKT